MNGNGLSTGSSASEMAEEAVRGRIEDYLEKRIVTAIKHTKINNSKNNKYIEQIFGFHLPLPTKV